jgi:GST-like protein
MLEECQLPYRVVRVDLGANEQKQLPFLEINPNGRVPAIVDYEQAERPQPVFESGAILLYLAEKTGCFLAPSGRGRIEAFEWLMWQMSGLGPMAGQAHHFRTVAPEDNAYAQKRYVSETKRLYGVMNDRLRQHSWLAGDEYSVADMACWGWIWFHKMQGLTLLDFPHIGQWFFAISTRPAVIRGVTAHRGSETEQIALMLQAAYYDQAPGDGYELFKPG